MWQHFFHVEGVAAALAIAAQTIATIIWLMNKRDESRANRRFVRDMGTNHLPHIYQRLGAIDYRMGIEPVQPPSIQFEAEGAD